MAEPARRRRHGGGRHRVGDSRAVWGPPVSDEGRTGAAQAGARPGGLAGPWSEPILEGRELVRTYGGRFPVRAVRGVSVAIAPGDFIALMGPSGSGKTTLLGLLSGLDRPDAGEVRWRGAPLDRMSEPERLALRRRAQGMVFQSFGLLPTLSAVENVEFPLRLSGVDPDDAHDRAAAWLARLGLADRLDNRTSELSAGQLQRVAVARGLVAEPDVVLADEPIAEVDSENAERILEVLREVVDRGGAVVCATHNPVVLAHATRAVLLRDGQVVAEGTPDELTAAVSGGEEVADPFAPRARRAGLPEAQAPGEGITPS